MNNYEDTYTQSHYFIVSSRAALAPIHYEDHVKDDICYYAYAKTEELAYDYIKQFTHRSQMIATKVSVDFIKRLESHMNIEEIENQCWGWIEGEDEPIMFPSTIEEMDIYAEDILPDGFELTGEEDSFVRLLALTKACKHVKYAKECRRYLTLFFNELQGADTSTFGKKFYIYKLKLGGLR